jgi:cytoskeletal protein CcmA (bactofilin family)
MKAGSLMPFTKESAMKEHTHPDDISGFLAEGTEITGEIRFRQILRLDGKISGKIHSEGELIIGETGEVDAEIHVATLSVSGKATGSFHIKEKMEIQPKGRVSGDLTMEKPNFLIQEGGIFEGNVDMSSSSRHEKTEKKKESPVPLAGVEPIRRPGA